MELWAAGVTGLLFGVILGGLSVYYAQKNKGGGKTAGEIHAELREYKQQVQEHFDKTSDMFRDMTHQYRELYDHLSIGAQSLCETSSITSSLAQAARNVLPTRGRGQEEDAADGEPTPTETAEPQESGTHGPVSPAGASKPKNADVESG